MADGSPKQSKTTRKRRSLLGDQAKRATQHALRVETDAPPVRLTPTPAPIRRVEAPPLPPEANVGAPPERPKVELTPAPPPQRPQSELRRAITTPEMSPPTAPPAQPRTEARSTISRPAVSNYDAYEESFDLFGDDEALDAEHEEPSHPSVSTDPGDEDSPDLFDSPEPAPVRILSTPAPAPTSDDARSQGAQTAPAPRGDRRPDDAAAPPNGKPDTFTVTPVTAEWYESGEMPLGQPGAAAGASARTLPASQASWATALFLVLMVGLLGVAALAIAVVSQPGTAEAPASEAPVERAPEAPPGDASIGTVEPMSEPVDEPTPEPPPAAEPPEASAPIPPSEEPDPAPVPASAPRAKAPTPTRPPTEAPAADVPAEQPPVSIWGASTAPPVDVPEPEPEPEPDKRRRRKRDK